jgi:hypothetical protein
MKIFYLQPRQVGKTTMAMYEYLKDRENSLFVTHNMDMAKDICNRLNGNNEDFITCNQFIKEGRPSKKYKTIILDEYMFFRNKEEVYKKVLKISPENLLIFSTADKRYNEELLKFIKNAKYKFTYLEIMNMSIGWKHNETYELYYNFLTDSDVKLITHNLVPKKTEELKKRYKNYSPETYKTEILNEYLK